MSATAITETTRLQDQRLEELSLLYGGRSIEVFESRDGSITARTPDGSFYSYDENGIPPCRVHEVFDCADVNCQVAYAQDGI